jgi:hypothetical protein
MPVGEGFVAFLQTGVVYEKLVIGVLPPILTVIWVDKLQDFEVGALNEISSNAKSLPAEAILVSIIFIVAIVATPEFHVPEI